MFATTRAATGGCTDVHASRCRHDRWRDILNYLFLLTILFCLPAYRTPTPGPACATIHPVQDEPLPHAARSGHVSGAGASCKGRR